MLKAGTITQPSFTHGGDEAWVVQNGATKPEVYRISTTGNPEPGTGGLRRIRRQGSGHRARALTRTAFGLPSSRVNGCIWGC